MSSLPKALDHKGKIGVIAGDFKQAGHRMCVAGFEKYMEKEPGITIEMVRTDTAICGFPRRMWMRSW